MRMNGTEMLEHRQLRGDKQVVDGRRNVEDGWFKFAPE
jgi:hypothetical protein